MNCELSALVSIGLFSASFACSTSSDPEKLKTILTDSQYDLYESIVIERSTIYLHGLIVGILVAILVSSRLTFDNAFHDVCFFTGVAWAVAVLYYLAVPKSKYIIHALQKT